MINRFRAAVAVATFAALAASAAVAQQPAPPAKAPPKAAPKAPAKSPAAPAPAAQAPAAPAATSGNTVGNQTLPVIYTPWVKICQKPPQQQPGQPQEICITTRTGLLEIGQPVITGEIVETQSAPKQRILRVTMPLGVALARGTQYYVDANTPKETTFSTCMGSGCIADYEATDDVIKAMKGGQNFISRAFDFGGALITLQLPLGAEFAKVLDGPATDPNVLQQQQKNIQDIIQKNQQRIQQQQQQQQGGAAPAAPAK